MGEARRRGTFEERKAEAIAAGRIKRNAEKRRVSTAPHDHAGLLAMAMLAGHRMMGKKARKRKARS